MTTPLPTYPDRAALVSEMCALLRCARRPLSEEDARYGIDDDATRRLYRLAHRLACHGYFEHRTRDALVEGLRSHFDEYRSRLAERPRPDLREFSGRALDDLAAAPGTWEVVFGLEHVDLPAGLRIGDVTFLHGEDAPDIAQAFREMLRDVPRLLAATIVVAGTGELARLRAKRSVERALALVRQNLMFGFRSKMYPGQLAFGFDGRYVIRFPDGVARAGWWARTRPIDMDLSAQTEWAERLTQMAQLRDSLHPPVNERVDTALEWMDVAARSESWRTMLPAVFSAMEALLVPERSGKKAGAVTVRSVAVHVALGEGFFDPARTVAGYEWRSRLVHGSPTADVDDQEFNDFAEDRRLWGFMVFGDYLKLANRLGLHDVHAIVRTLDEQTSPEVCQWLLEHGGGEVVAEYHDLLAHPEGESRSQPQTPSGVTAVGIENRSVET